MKLGKETCEQIAVVDWLILNKLPVFAIINQGKRTLINGRILKRMGMRAGVCDLFIFRATLEYHGCFLEMKTGKGILSKEQQDFIDDAIKEGYFAKAVWGFDEAIMVIKTLYKT